ncbi:DUF1206 domain-containing protein [Serinibacter salmoneus]|uniref:Uncharacterized protein DUF1206 n=1 Tax=Serinibacter salmoneus TaxID=556530 RepID=A0A2A9CYS0_9MICO|nr:DUF1206 domain-containing protein [Serinibacter salmoneus]PFG18729.1 uncharacterized protein DUF1206 [Serinibacter salmoneus]
MSDSATSRPDASDAADAAGTVWERLARAGFVALGVLHLLIGFAIVRIAVGSSSGQDADQQGALRQLAQAPLGAILLWVIAVAFLALAAWKIAAAFGSGADAKETVKSLGNGVVYLALAFLAASIVLGAGGGSGDSSAQGFAGTLMQAPAGRVLVGGIGVGVLAAGVWHVIKGARQTFLEDLRAAPGGELGRGVRILGTVGYVAKGLALAVIGVLFAVAAWQADPDEAQGLDGAISSLRDLPGGPIIVAAVGVGFAAYGLYAFARARYARL